MSRRYQRSWSEHLTADPYGTLSPAPDYGPHKATERRNDRVALARAAALVVRYRADDLRDACSDLVPNTQAQADDLREHVALARKALVQVEALIEAMQPAEGER